MFHPLPHTNNPISFYQVVLMKFLRFLYKFLIGGALYTLLELLWRGYSHWTMFIVGGLCFRIICATHTQLKDKMGMGKQCIVCAAVVTMVEFISGCIINVWFGLGVWDYSNVPFNPFGQVCLPYLGLWVIASYAAARRGPLFVWQAAYTFKGQIQKRGKLFAHTR